jgi:tetratricopeptide (TPR) repeat protein
VAEPGTVLITAAVHRHLAGLFVAEDMGAHNLKGVPTPVMLYRVVRASGGGRRARARSLTPFVGREEDLALILRRWERARAGEGQFVQVVGEPGIGKSRLFDEFRARLGETPHTWVEWASSQLLQNTPLHPLTEWGRLRFGGADIAPEKRLAALESALAQVRLDPAENAPLLAPLLDIPMPAERMPPLAAEELRRRQLAALAAWLVAGARAQPIVLAIEDLQWADPTSLDLMKTLAERGGTAPLFILASSRPEFSAPWATRSHHGVVSLAPLDRGQIRAMVGAVAQRHALSEEVVEGVTGRTGGVPLFVEEVTRLLLEGGAQTIPPTLQLSLAARLDRLGDAREIAQFGAVLGREFAYSLLRSVAAADGRSPGGIDDPALQSALDRLAEADVLFVEGIAPEATYRFKHALIQDAAYESLIKSRRQALHRHAAKALVAAPGSQPELVAHHFTQAGETDLAIEWWGKAGDLALKRSAFREAASHLAKAIDHVDQTARNSASGNDERLTKLLLGYSRALSWSEGFSSNQTKAALERAGKVMGATEGIDARLSIWQGQWSNQILGGNFKEAMLNAETTREMARLAERPVDVAAACCAAGLAAMTQAEFELARTRFDEVLEIARCTSDEKILFSRRYVYSNLTASTHLAQLNWLKGRVTEAKQQMSKAVLRANSCDHPPTAANIYNFWAMFAIWANDPVSVHSACNELVRFGSERGMRLYGVWGQAYSGWAMSKTGNPAIGADLLRSALDEYLRLNNKMGVAFFYWQLAEAEMTLGHWDDALSYIDRGLFFIETLGERWMEPMLHFFRATALIYRDSSDPADAESSLQKALTVATTQGSRSFGLRAAVKLAKLYQSQGRFGDMRRSLAPTLEGFSPTPDMPEIAEAVSLLSQLA